MNKFGEPWTTVERATLLRLRAQGLQAKEIAEHLPGRSPKAIGNFVSRQNLKRQPRRPPAPIPPAKPDERILAAHILAAATNAAIARFANDNSLTEQEARAILLGREPQSTATRFRPSAPRPIGHRPDEIFARPIGEVIKPIVARVSEGSR